MEDFYGISWRSAVFHVRYSHVLCFSRVVHEQVLKETVSQYFSSPFFHQTTSPGPNRNTKKGFIIVNICSLIIIALNSFQALGNDVSGCLKVDVILEKGIKRSRVSV
jgi:hypothetical protein